MVEGPFWLGNHQLVVLGSIRDQAKQAIKIRTVSRIPVTSALACASKFLLDFLPCLSSILTM